MKRTCKQCGKPFELTDSEINFYRSKGLDLPRRCPECRAENRAAKEASGKPRRKGLPMWAKIAVLVLIAAVIAIRLIPFSPQDPADPGYHGEYKEYYFRSDKYLNEHYEKHGIEMGYGSPEEYRQGACDVINDPESLYKVEAEDGDDVYYREATNDFVVVSTDGYIRTYFRPDSGMKYFEKQ